MAEPVFVFVYGTLKKGFGNHRVLGKSRFIGEALTNEKFIMYDGPFPWVSTMSNQEEYLGYVWGELYEVTSNNILQDLDSLEGVPYMYVRKEVDVTVLNGSVFPAIMYVASEGSNENLKTKIPMKPISRGEHLEW